MGSILNQDFLTLSPDGPMELVKIRLGPHFGVRRRSVDPFNYSNLPAHVAETQDLSSAAALLRRTVTLKTQFDVSSEN